MQTDDLIAALAEHPAPVRARLSWPLVAAATASLFLLWLALGTPFAALGTIGVAPYAMKLAFALSVAGLALTTLYASGQPGRGTSRHALVLAAPFAALLVLAGMELASTGTEMPGTSWRRCLLAITLLTPLSVSAAVAVVRRLAPTRLRLSGALTGIAGAAIAASAYAPWCPETTALFLLIWYAGPILIAGLAGALTGPSLLRW